jgi:uncharacterized protein YndB with AHSA1/START domain
VTGDPAPATAVVQRVLPAPPEVVYDEWLDAEGLAEWMCPRPARPTKIELDPRVGGRLRIDIDDQGYRLQVTGTYLDLRRPHQLSFTWKCSDWPEPDHESVVTVLLRPHGDQQTLMTIRHSLLPPEVADGHRQGWGRVAAQLDGRLPARVQDP